jgi:glucoamylase
MSVLPPSSRRLPRTHLWLEDEGHFARLLTPGADGYQADATLDASLVGLWLFGMLKPEDPRIAMTMERLRERLWVRTKIGGMARYEGDRYHHSGDDDVPGNPWFISTLWLAQWQIAVAKRSSDLQPALELLQWAAERALPSGVMAEQVHPDSGAPLSVSPLTWSHATFISTARAYLTKRQVLERREGVSSA